MFQAKRQIDERMEGWADRTEFIVQKHVSLQQHLSQPKQNILTKIMIYIGTLGKL